MEKNKSSNEMKLEWEVPEPKWEIPELNWDITN